MVHHRPENTFQTLFGQPFWDAKEQESMPRSVLAFISAANVSNNRDLLELQVEVVSEASCHRLADLRYFNTTPGRAQDFEELEVAFAVIEINTNDALRLFATEGLETLEGRWRQLSLGPSWGDGPRIQFLSSLEDTEGSSQSIVGSSAPDPMVVGRLSTNLGTMATWTDIWTLLDSYPDRPLDIGVLDVGQAASAFLFHNQRQPQIYFDLGRPIWKNIHTFPANKVTWCFSQKPLVILSHWHWDHWSAASTKAAAGALKMHWICPDQPTGGATRRFQAKILAATGSIILWPASLPPISTGYLSLGRASGSKCNDSGLVLLNKSVRGGYALLPGDAPYHRIHTDIAQLYATKGLETLLISHHGGDYGGGPIPKPDGRVPNIAVCSVGDKNTYGHPTHNGDHTSVGWTVVGTDARQQGQPAHHLNAYTGGLNGQRTRPACGGQFCSLELWD